MAGCQLRGGFRCPPLLRSTISAPPQQLDLTMRQGQSRLDARALRATWTIQGLRTVGACKLKHTRSAEERNEQHRPVPCMADSQRANIRAPAPDQVENPVCRFPAWPHGRSLLYVGRLHQSPGGEVWLDDGDVGAPLPVSYTH